MMGIGAGGPAADSKEATVTWWGTLAFYWREITTWAFFADIVLVLVVVPWILAIKKEPTSAIAWSLFVLLVPIVGAFLFVMFGYQSVYRPLVRKRRHRTSFRAQNPTGRHPVAAEAASA